MSLREKLRKFMLLLLSFLMAVLVVDTAVQVLFRYVLNSPLYWTDELARYLFIWITFIGGAVAVERRAHLSLDFFYEKMPRTIKAIFKVIINLSAGVFLTAIVITGIKILSVTADQPSAMMGIPMAVPYLAVPIGAALMTMYLGITMVEDVKKILAGKEENGDAGGVE